MEVSLKRRGINKNNLLPWFTQDHGTLPASYLRSCERFFKTIGSISRKRSSREGGPEGCKLTSATKKTQLNDIK
jgi:hypothetical protein